MSAGLSAEVAKPTLVNADSESLKIISAPVPPNKGRKDVQYSEMIPENLLFALTEVNTLLKAKEDELAPVKALKTPKEMRIALKKGAPDSVWHHKNRRLNFRHLTDHPRSDGKTAGSKDISFLYDVSSHMKKVPESPSRYDKSASRLQTLSESKSSSTNLAVPDSIIPDEYHLVKSKAVIGLDYVDDKMTTNLVDQEKAMRVFPSLKPTKRFEVLQLMKTMDQMLSRAGVDDIENEAKGPTQIHNLLEVIKKEQQIYDIVFHEVIRQVSVECIERGQLISKLRQRYADLLNRIPRQIKSLHAEVMAQRSLDRRLTEELLRFKTSIGNLTSELVAVREHDKKITREAEIAQLDLAEALKESQKNANLVDEYHDLYELQRRRLEAQVTQLTEERDLWCNASYSLALKIVSENSLSTAKRLHVTEKAWHKLAGHFNVVISDHDTESLVLLQNHVESWRDLLFHFHQVLEAADKTTANVLTLVKDGLRHWITIFEDTLIGFYEDTDIRTIKLPPSDMIETLQSDIANWEQLLSENCERFGGDTLLNNQEQLIKMAKEVELWTDVAITVYDRHRSDTGESYHQRPVMRKNNETFQNLTKHLEVRIAGENGVAKGMITLQNSLDNWNSRFIVSMRGAEVVTDAEWLKFFDLMQEYETMISETITCIVDVENNEQNESKSTTVEEMIEMVQKWLKNTVNGIEGENGKLAAQVSSIHTRMIHWMVQALLLLAPDKGNKIPLESSLMAGCSVEELKKKCLELSDHVSRVTAYICQCTNNIVQLSTQKKKDAGDDDADHEYRDFVRVKAECKEWIRTCQLLLNTLLEEPVTLLDEVVLARLDHGKVEVRKKTAKGGSDKHKKEAEKVNEKESDGGEGAAIKKSEESIKTSTSAEDSTAESSAKPSQESVKTQESEKEDTAEQKPARIPSLEIIGADENVQSTSLDDMQTVQSVSQTGMSDALTPPSSALTQTAYDAIAKMDELQQQLLSTEERAQEAESKSFQLEEDLNVANEKIRALERQVADMEKEKERARSGASEKLREDKPSLDKPTTSVNAPSPDPIAKPPTPEPGKRASSRAGTDRKKQKPKKK